MNQLFNILRQADIFYDVPQELLEKLCTVCRQETYNKGDVIVKENEPSDELYVIIEGNVEIVVDPRLLNPDAESSTPEVIATLWPGQTFGEIGLVDRGRRSASVVAAADGTTLQVVSREDLLKLCDENHTFGYYLMRNIAAGLAFKIRNADLILRERSL